MQLASMLYHNSVHKQTSAPSYFEQFIHYLLNYCSELFPLNHLYIYICTYIVAAINNALSLFLQVASQSKSEKVHTHRKEKIVIQHRSPNFKLKYDHSSCLEVFQQKLDRAMIKIFPSVFQDRPNTLILCHSP